MAASLSPATASLLAPWLRHAKRCMVGVLDDLAEPDDLDDELWIDWRLPSAADASTTAAGPDAWIMTLETFELLDLMVRLDYRNGWLWILETLEVSLYIRLLDALPRTIYPKHTIRWTSLSARARGDGSSFERAELLLRAIPEELHSPQYRRVKQMMVEQCGQSAASGRIRVCLRLELNAVEPEEAPARALERVAQLAALAQDPVLWELRQELRHAGAVTSVARQAGPATSPRGAFVFARVAINSFGVALTDGLLASIRAIRQCGVHVAALTLGTSQHAAGEMTPQETAHFLRSLVCGGKTHQTLALSIGHDMDASVFQSICSALVSSPNVNDVTLSARNRLPHYWSWITYALFSSDVSHRIQYIHLDVLRFTDHDVADVRRMLYARDPLAALPPTPQTHIPDDALARLARGRESVDVRPGTTGRLSIHGLDPELAAITIKSRTCTDLRVVDDSMSRTHLSVLFPGAGVCWVAREDVVARRSCHAPRASQSVPFHRISFEIGNDTSLAALLSLIELIGSRTRILMMYSPQYASLPDSFLRDVLAFCPHLERLDLVMVTLTSFAWLIENPRLQHLQSFSMARVRCLHVDGYAQLIAALQDDARGIGRSLQELAIHTHLRLLRPVVPQLVDVLARNHRLERILLRTEYIVGMDNDLDALTGQLHAHNGTPVHGQAKPLAFRERLAMLSIFTHTKLPELDAAMLAIVFALAAPSKRRVCGFLGSAIHR